MTNDKRRSFRMKIDEEVIERTREEVKNAEILEQ